MDEERLREDEYEKQYYGFSSLEIYEDFKKEVSKFVKLKIKDMGADEVFQNEKNFEIYTAYMENARDPLQKFKDEARKIFAIPRNVILDSDKYNIDEFSNEDIIQLKTEVGDLEQELIREQVFLAKCKQQKEIADTVIKVLYEKVNCINKYLKSSCENVEAEKNNKMSEIYEKNIQYYFNNGSVENEPSDVFDVERNFAKKSDNFFK